MNAIVNVPICALYAAPTRQSTLVDEALYGMVVELLEQAAPGWYRVRTHYRYEGFAAEEDLLTDEARVAQWLTLPKNAVRHKHFCDVLSQPKVQGWHLQWVPMGGLVSPVGPADEGWQRVALADGRLGFAPAGILGPCHTSPCADQEPALRQALVDAAMAYRGTHYRWGGKTPQGIDCSGLVSMAYLLCGIVIYRDAAIKDGFPIRQISLEALGPGDLLFFPGHVAMYIGGGRYCHSTARAGDNGFTVNSLDPAAPDYRADLRERITEAGSYF